MTTILATLGVLAATVAVLVGLLRLIAAGGRRLANGGEPAPVDADTPPLLVPDEGWLSDEERQEQGWAEAATRRDLERIDAAVRHMEHGLNALFEKTLSRLGLEQTERNWARLTSGEHPLVGAR